MSDILVFAEHTGGKVKKTAFELLGKASNLAGGTGGIVIALAVGKGLDGLTTELASYGAKKVVLAEGDGLDRYNTLAYTTVLEKIIAEFKPSIVLASASAAAKDFFPRLSCRIKAGLASEATDLRLEDGKLVAKKPVYAGKAFVDVAFNTPVQMATTRPNSFAIGAPIEGARAEVIRRTLNVGEPVNPIREFLQGQGATRADLTEAEAIVSGGRAMGSADNFKVLQPLADLLGATVGASRAAVDSGYASHDMQVGQTGKVVNPKLYIACGISGAIQHLAGMRTSKVIVAINKDPEAPIFQKSDYGLVGDLFTLVPLIAEEVKKLQG